MTTSTNPLARPPGDSNHRKRLLDGMAAMAASKGVAATTIADIVREAGVSKRTFYEHFRSKEDCFLQLYRQVAAASLHTLGAALAPERPWQTQVETALQAYFAHLAQAPRLMRALFVEVHHLGPEGMAVRREVMQQFADFMLEVVNGPALAGGQARRMLTRTMAMAAVGGINELVLELIEQGREAEVTSLTQPAAEIVRVLTHAETAAR
jgi:AcrR family transcriptional regulator